MLNRPKQKSKTTMSKTRRKTHDEGENYRGIIRQLKKENSQLKRELRQYTKRENLYEDNKEEIQEILSKKEEVELRRIRCTDCSKGYFEETEFLGKVYGTCDTCGYRKRLK